VRAYSDRVWALFMLADTQYEAGELDGARDTIDEGLAFARRIDEPAYVGWHRLLAARIARRRGDLADAAHQAGEAAAVAEDLEMRPLTAHVELFRGVLARDRGDRAAARAHFETAARALRAARWDGCAARAKAELAATS
jgi:ATP/maltotriose-dependent transcriptional regulator MalT